MLRRRGERPTDERLATSRTGWSSRTTRLAEAAWARGAPLLPANGRRGKRWADHRRILVAILRVLRTGAPWREIPEECGPWQSAHSRHRRWCQDGTWAHIPQALPGQG